MPTSPNWRCKVDEGDIFVNTARTLVGALTVETEQTARLGKVFGDLVNTCWVDIAGGKEGIFI